MIESLQYQRNVIDRGCTLDEQINKQLSVFSSLEGQVKSEEELLSLWNVFDDAVTLQDYSAFSSRCNFFEGDLSVTSAGALHTEFDFLGNKLSNMWDLDVEAQMLCHSILATDHGGAIAFVWLTQEVDPLSVVSSFDSISNDDKSDIFVQYCFLTCENTYFARTWWETLGSSQQNQLKTYASALYYEGGAYIANTPRFVHWKITGSKTNQS